MSYVVMQAGQGSFNQTLRENNLSVGAILALCCAMEDSSMKVKVLVVLHHDGVECRIWEPLSAGIVLVSHN